jgi:CP family cyanate transporter-like MFS transporter
VSGRDLPLPLWAGRTTALVGIALVALTLRLAVAAVSPILDPIGADIALSSVTIGVLGMLPPALFAVSGFVGPPLARRIGLERSLIVGLVLMIVGQIGRALAPEVVTLAVGTGVALLGMGMGNVLLPPIVRRYFPDRVALVTALYAALLAVSSSVPALLASPVAAAVGWRTSLGVWSIVCVIALVPWVRLATRSPRSDGASAESPAGDIVRGLRRSRTARAITLVFALTSLNMYAGFAWLPEIFADLSGVGASQAGALLAIVAFAGFPGSIVAPLLVARLRNVGWVVIAGIALFLVGYLGLLAAPGSAPVLWALAIGIAPVLFPVSLVLINARTRTHEGSVALSGFVQGIGYTAGAFGPLVVGVLHDLTEGWTAPLVFLLVTLFAGVVAAVALARPRFVEDELAQRPGTSPLP